MFVFFTSHKGNLCRTVHFWGLSIFECIKQKRSLSNKNNRF